MPSFQFWFSGAPFGNFVLLLGAIITLGYGWYGAARDAERTHLSAAQALVDRISYTISVAASVVARERPINTIQQDLQIELSNTSLQPLQHDVATFNIVLDETAVPVATGNPGIISAGRTSTYSIPLGTLEALKSHELTLAIDFHYGYPGKKPVIAAHHDMKVRFFPRGVSTDWTAEVVNWEEQTIR